MRRLGRAPRLPAAGLDRGLTGGLTSGPSCGLAASLALCAVVLASGCAQGAPKSVVVAVAETPETLDPVRAASPAEENACELVFDGLVNVAANDSGAASPVLGLAESIAQDQSDRALYHITLREAKWHDGRALDSEDVAASFAAYADPVNRSPRREYLLGLIASVAPEGRRSVSVRFREPIAEFRAWYVLAFKIIPKEYRGASLPSNHGKTEGLAFASEPVGTGPFRFQSRRGGDIYFAAEPSSWRGPPASAGIELRRIPETKDRIKAFLKGRADIIFDTGPLDRAELERADGAMVQSFMPHSFYALAINTRALPLSKGDARRALARAIDRRNLLPGVTDRQAGIELNCGPFPEDLLMKVLPEYFRQGFPDRLPWDSGKAAALAASSSLPGKASASSPGELSILAPASWGAFGEKLADGLVGQLGLSGISARKEILPDESYRSRLESRSYDLALVLHEGYDNLFSGISALYRSGSPENETGISDADLDRLLERRESAVEVTEWIRDTLALHELVSGLEPYVPLFTLEKDIFYRNMRGFVIASDNPFLTAERWQAAK